VWERRPGHDDHLHVRLGIGQATARPSPRRASGGGEPGADPALSALTADLLGRYDGVERVPLGLDLSQAPAAVVLGEQLALLRAMIVSLTRAHGPQSVRLHALAAPAELAWIRALPHAGCTATDPAALAAGVRTQLRGSGTDPGQPLHAIVLAGTADSTLHAWHALVPLLNRHPRSPVSLIGLLPEGSPVPQEACVVVSADGEGGLLVRRTGQRPARTAIALPDAISHPQARRYAETMRRCLTAQAPAGLQVSPLLLDSLTGGAQRPRLRIPIGVDDDGAVVLLDPREAARHGDGPHGLIVAATGSGKSELLRTLLRAAAQQNRPDE
jgi:S-DNA-T family DNA segregation ATPase FtsK/SpoIIIE